jgi:hypothetical protein
VKQPEAIEQQTPSGSAKDRRSRNIMSNPANVGQPQVISDDKIAEGTSLTIWAELPFGGQMQKRATSASTRCSKEPVMAERTIVLANIGLQLDEMGRSAESVVSGTMCRADGVLDIHARERARRVGTRGESCGAIGALP